MNSNEPMEPIGDTMPDIANESLLPPCDGDDIAAILMPPLLYVLGVAIATALTLAFVPVAGDDVDILGVERAVTLAILNEFDDDEDDDGTNDDDRSLPGTDNDDFSSLCCALPVNDGAAVVAAGVDISNGAKPAASALRLGTDNGDDCGGGATPVAPVCCW